MFFLRRSQRMAISIYAYINSGEGVIEAVAKLINNIKHNSIDFTEVMNVCNVTSLYKNKGDRNKFDSHQGVFRTTTLRNI